MIILFLDIVLVAILWMAFGFTVAYFDTENRQQNFDINAETIAKAIKWPWVLRKKFKK